MIVTLAEWSRFASLTGLTSAALPAEVICGLESGCSDERAAQVAAEARLAAIRICRRCDEKRWQLAVTPVDPARQCDHAVARLAAVRGDLGHYAEQPTGRQPRSMN